MATVSGAGLASTWAVGVTTITATLNSIANSATLTVGPPSPFTLTGSMASARREHNATLLNNGNVLITGGDTAYSGTAELYNPGAGSFGATSSMTTGRYEHTATLLNNGTVLIAGGQGGSGYLATAALYDTATGTFASRAA